MLSIFVWSANRQVDAEPDNKNHAQSLATTNTKAKRKADLKQSQVDGLAGLIASNAKLTVDEVDDICAVVKFLLA
jgi:hypothetical protein